MVEIKLTQGQIARVCDCHYHLVKDYKWCAEWDDNRNKFRAARSASVFERMAGFPPKVLMHAVINNTPKGFHTDHKDGNSLNNQCFNLRDATPSQNGMNRGKQANNTSGYKGVTYRASLEKWQSRIKVDGKEHNLGLFVNPEEAARAYDTAAIKFYGEFANTNFKEEA